MPKRVILLSIANQLAISTSFSLHCSICVGSDEIENEYDTVLQKTCRQLSYEALFSNSDDDICLTHYNLLGFTHCGCGPPPEKPDSNCGLCIDGSMPPLLNSPYDQEGVFTCGEVYDYLLHFPQSSDTCDSFQGAGINMCGCPDIHPSNQPSNFPTSVIEKEPDCDALRDGIFPLIDEDLSQSIGFQYDFEIFLDTEFNFTDVESELQGALSNEVSANAAGCGEKENRRHLHERKLEDLKIYYVDFDQLVQSGEVCTTPSNVKGKCVIVNSQVAINHSILSAESSLQTSEDSFRIIIDKIVEENGVIISESVNGVLGLYISKKGNSSRSKTTSAETRIGLGVGFSIASFGALLYMSKRSKIKKYRGAEENIEFLPTLLVRSDQAGVEIYPDPYIESNDDIDETESNNSYPANKFPIRHPEREVIIANTDCFEMTNTHHDDRDSAGLYPDSSSSDEDLSPFDENKNRRVITRKRSFILNNTAEV